MSQLYAETIITVAYLRRFVTVVEMWECQWREVRPPPPPETRRWSGGNITRSTILKAVLDGNPFGLLE